MNETRHTTPRRHVARAAAKTAVPVFLGVVASWRPATAQWTTSPPRPTVGDTIRLERLISVPAGWRVRAGKLEATEEVEPLAEPAVLRSPGGWLVRYAVVAWTPGAHPLTLPPIWRVAPDGRADSAAGGAASFTVASVLPDTGPRPEPKGLIGPLRSGRRNPVWPLLAVALSGGLLAAGLAWRRRPPGEPAAPLRVPLEPEVPDASWLAAGEPKAVTARATWRLRAALARAVPEAHPALSTSECLAVVARVRPDAPLRELQDLLGQLDDVAFASDHGTDLAGLAAMARRLAQELAP